MTESEALAIVQNIIVNHDCDDPRKLVRSLEALGVIKFEPEPKMTVQGQINHAIWNGLWPKYTPECRVAPMDIVDALAKYDLKIVRNKA